MYTMIMSDEPIASGAKGVPFIKVNAAVRTRKNVPMNSVR